MLLFRQKRKADLVQKLRNKLKERQASLADDFESVALSILFFLHVVEQIPDILYPVLQKQDSGSGCVRDGAGGGEPVIRNESCG